MSGRRDEVESLEMGGGRMGPPPPQLVVPGVERDAYESHDEEATDEGNQ